MSDTNTIELSEWPPRKRGRAGEAFALTLKGVTPTTDKRFDCMRDGRPVEVKTTAARGWSRSTSAAVDALIKADGWWLFVLVDPTGEVRDYEWVRAADHPRAEQRVYEDVYFPSSFLARERR